MLVLVLGLTPAVAASLPGDAFYPVKQAVEQAKFKGSIEMDQQQVDAAFGRTRGTPKAAPDTASRPSGSGEAAKPVVAASEPKGGAPAVDKPQGGTATKTGSAG